MVVFTFIEEPFDEEDEMSTEEALRILEKYKGSIKGDFDAKAEKLAYLNERYGNI